MVLGIVLDEQDRPIASFLWPGNTADVTTLLPVVERLRSRFGVERACIVADRGMISARRHGSATRKVSQADAWRGCKSRRSLLQMANNGLISNRFNPFAWRFRA
jgi:hypothetical protein